MDEKKPIWHAIIPGHIRGVNKTVNPMILLTGITKDGVLFRDHHWIQWHKKIGKFMPKPHSKKKVLIEFQAEEIEYLSSEGKKKGLKKIKNVKVLNRSVLSKDWYSSNFNIKEIK